MQEIDCDFMEAHESVLGRIVDSVASTPCVTRPAALVYSDEPRYRTVLATFSGYVGDSGVFSAPGLPAYPNKNTARRITAFRTRFATSLLSCEVIRQAKSATIAGLRSSGLALSMGVDNRTLLPPFLPVFEGEGAVFTRMLEFCYPFDYCCHLPFAILHDHRRQRRYGDVITNRVSDYVIGAIAFARARNPGLGVMPGERLSSLGKSFKAIGDLSLSEFEEWMREIAMLRATGLIRAATSTMSVGNIPFFYRERLCRMVDRLTRTNLLRKNVVPKELMGISDIGSQIDRQRQVFRNFGELLCWWPEIMSRARRVVQSGGSVCELITG
jgi:hypothetical protein